MSKYTELPGDWEDPEWGRLDKCHEWKRYISKDIEEMWPELPEKLKKALAIQANEIAEREEWD